MLDVLWSVASYERLVVDWELDAPDAVNGVTWAIGLVVDAIKSGLARAPTLVERGDELCVRVERRGVRVRCPYVHEEVGHAGIDERPGVVHRPHRRQHSHRCAVPAGFVHRGAQRGMLVIGSAASSPQGIHP